MASNNFPKTKGGINDWAEIIREVDFWSKNRQKEENLSQKKFERLQKIHHQEKVIFSQKKQETQNQIKSIQKELKFLGSPIKSFNKEVDKVIEQTPVNPGIYHVNFLEKIRQIVVVMRKRTEDSSTWLEAFNQKMAKKHNFWYLAKKVGTQWSLSGERYVATSVG